MAARGTKLYRPRSSGKDSQSDNKGHKRSRLHVNRACLPCTTRRQRHARTHTHNTAQQGSCCHNNSPCALLIGTACLARQQQGERQTHKQWHNRQTCILQEPACDWHRYNGWNMKIHKAPAKKKKKERKVGQETLRGPSGCCTTCSSFCSKTASLAQQKAQKINTH